MPRRATIQFVSLKSCLVNLPISMYGPLVEHRVRPQSLAVHLAPTTPSGTASAKPVYVGWTGMASSSSLAQWQNRDASNGLLETVEIDPQFAGSFGLQQGSIVEIGLLYDLPSAKSVIAEPVSSDDWEILELHAEFVEDNFLSQVRIASVGQEVNIWVLGRTRIRFRIESITPKSLAALLTNDTELAIAPKARVKFKSPVASHGSKAVEVPERPPMKKRVLRVLPRAALHQETPISAHEAVAFVSPDMYAAIVDSVVLHREYGIDSAARHVFIRRLHAPVMRSSAHVSSRPMLSREPRILNTAKASQDNVSTGKGLGKSDDDDTVVLLKCHNDVPYGHTVVLGDSIYQDWDIICVIGLANKPQKTPSNGESSSLKELSPFQERHSKTTLAGVDSLIRTCQKYLSQAMTMSQDRAAGRVVIGGNPGSGRTSVSQEIARRLRDERSLFAYTLFIDLAKHADDSLAVLKTLFQDSFKVAMWHRPTLIVFDNLDKVVSAEVEHVDPSRARQIAEVFLKTFGSVQLPPEIGLLATCENQQAIHPLLFDTHALNTYVPIPMPDHRARQEILSQAVQRRFGPGESQEDHLNYAALAAQCEGYSASDLQDWVGRAVHQAAIRSSNQRTLLPIDFSTAQSDFTPLALRNVKLQSSNVEWADIGGLHETRRILRETLEWPTKYAAIFAKCPLRLRSGLLLYGFPGCGKTLLASAVAKECGLHFISVKGPELLNKYIGASEQSVRDLFARATAAKPCVLFFDEFDSIAPKRGHDSTGVTDRVVNQLLTLMDGAEKIDGVYVLAATSRPDLIDPALLRPGRLDKSLLCGMPNAADRAEILRALARKVILSQDIDMEAYARRTEGYSGADLQALVYNAHLEAVHASLLPHETDRSADARAFSHGRISYVTLGGTPDRDPVRSKAEATEVNSRLELMLGGSAMRRETGAANSAKGKSHSPVVIQDGHMQASLVATRPSLSAQERSRLSAIYNAFVAERSGELAVPPEAGGIGHRASLM